MISALIAAHNAAPYIRKTLSSLEQQTFKEFEVVVIDDFSTDETPSIVNNYVQKSSMQIKLIRLNSNCGVACVRNKCLDEARGDYLYFVDADDWLEPDAFRMFDSAIKSSRPDVLACNFFMGEKDAVKISVESVDEYRKNCIAGKWAVVWRHVFRKSFLVDEKITFPSNVNGGEDYFFVSKSIVLAKKISFLDECAYHYRIDNAGSLMRSVNLSGLKDQFLATELVRNFLQTVNNDAYDESLNLRILYLKKELFKTSLKAWKCWKPEANGLMHHKKIALKDKVVFFVLKILSRLL